MIRIALCDDRKADLDRIHGLLAAYLDEKKVEAEVMTFMHPDDLLRESEKTRFNLFVLDIMMPMVSGIEAARELRWNNRNAAIVFATAEPSFALESFDVNPVNYLLKPVVREKLYDTLDRVFEQIADEQEKAITIKEKAGFRTVFINDIMFLEYRNHVISYNLKNGDVISTPTLRIGFTDYLNETVSDTMIMQCHESYAVNIAAIDALTKTDAMLRNGKSVPVSKSRYTAVQAAYLDFRLA